MDYTTAHTEFFDGIPLLVPNRVIEADGFSISYNNYDVGIYGGVTTALIKEPMEHFYILYGDHREAYSNLISKGFDACMDYFKNHISEISKYSDIPSEEVE